MHLPVTARRRLTFVWDDSRASADFRYDAAWILDAADNLCLRAQMALCVGLFEWVHWRFEGLHPRVESIQVLEAAWCEVVRAGSLRFFDFGREDWQGPVLGPLWCGITWLRPAVAHGDMEPGEVADALQYLARLAVHVALEPQDVIHWIEETLGRWQDYYPPEVDDGFDDLFDRRRDERRGPQVPRTALYPFAPKIVDVEATTWAYDVLQTAAIQANPLVSLPPHF